MDEKKFRGLPKLDEAVGRVQFGSPRNFLNPAISKLDKHVVLLLINYIGSKQEAWFCGVEWDEEFPGDLKLTTHQWAKRLPEAPQVKIPS